MSRDPKPDPAQAAALVLDFLRAPPPRVPSPAIRRAARLLWPEGWVQWRNGLTSVPVVMGLMIFTEALFSESRPSSAGWNEGSGMLVLVAVLGVIGLSCLGYGIWLRLALKAALRDGVVARVRVGAVPAPNQRSRWNGSSWAEFVAVDDPSNAASPSDDRPPLATLGFSGSATIRVRQWFDTGKDNLLLLYRPGHSRQGFLYDPTPDTPFEVDADVGHAPVPPPSSAPSASAVGNSSAGADDAPLVWARQPVPRAVPRGIERRVCVFGPSKLYFLGIVFLVGSGFWTGLVFLRPWRHVVDALMDRGWRQTVPGVVTGLDVLSMPNWDVVAHVEFKALDGRAVATPLVLPLFNPDQWPDVLYPEVEGKTIEEERNDEATGSGTESDSRRPNKLVPPAGTPLNLSVEVAYFSLWPEFARLPHGRVASDRFDGPTVLRVTLPALGFAGAAIFALWRMVRKRRWRRELLRNGRLAAGRLHDLAPSAEARFAHGGTVRFVDENGREVVAGFEVEGLPWRARCRLPVWFRRNREVAVLHPVGKAGRVVIVDLMEIAGGRPFFRER